MERRVPTDEERAKFKTMMSEMVKARIEMFAANAPQYAQALGTFRSALERAGFSSEESMQIVLKVAEQPGMRPFWGGRRGHWHKKAESPQ